MRSKTLEAGFTTVRNVGSANYDDVALKQAIERGYIPGPRIVPATYALGATGGHCDATEFPPSIQVPRPQIANTPDEFRAPVRTMRKYGAEVIKVCMTGGVLSKTDSVGAQQISLDEIKAIVDEAHMLGMKVAVHAHGTEGINDALRAGVDTIEHASLADAESFKLAKAQRRLVRHGYLRRRLYPRRGREERRLRREPRQGTRRSASSSARPSAPRTPPG